MVDRSVEVRLRAEIAQFLASMGTASAAANLLASNLERADDRVQRLSASSQIAARRLRAQDRAAQGLTASLGDLNTAQANNNTLLASHTQSSNVFVRSNQQNSASINQLTGRLGLFADAALILGPGLVPIGAVGTQALMGMVNAAGALAITGASAVVAFQGIGDAVKAVDAYQLEPTAANLEKAEAAMAKLGPQAREFVMAFQEFQPFLGDIRDAAAKGWFPGLTDSLDDFEKIVPLVERIFLRSGEAGGTIADDVAESLGTERWQPFMRFVGREVQPAMYSLSRILGDIAHGFAEMWMSFDPGNDAFLDWLEDVADGFDRWASSDQGRDDIEGFLAYARENGPEVGAFFAALVDSLVGIVQASAPLGGPVLTVLTKVAEVFAAIAGSDLGSPIMAAVIALRIFNRTAALTAAVSQRAGASSLLTSLRAPFGAQPAQSFIGPMTQAQSTAAAAAQRRAQAAAIGKGVGLAAGAGFLMSGAAEDLNLTNTAMGALIGTMGGPWGVALGAAAGFALDGAKANDAFTDSVERTKAALAGDDLMAISDGLKSARDEQAALAKDLDKNDLSNVFDAGFWKSSAEGLVGDNDVEDSAKELAALEAQVKASQEAMAGLGETFGISVGEIDGSARSIRELQSVLFAARPAMEALGVETTDLTGAYNLQHGILGRLAGANSYDQLTGQIAEQAEYMDSAAARSDNYAAALRDLADGAGTAADRADALKAALGGLIDPDLDLEEALANWEAALDALGGLNPKAGFQDDTEKGRENLEISRDVTRALQERLDKMVLAEQGERALGEAVEETRREFIARTAAELGGGKEAIRIATERANAIKLTPKLVATTYKNLNIGKTTREVWALRELWRQIPAEKRAKITPENFPKTKAEARALARELDLTAKDRKTLIQLVDEAARSRAAALDRLLDAAAADRSSTITITTRRITLNEQRLAGAGVSVDGQGNAPTPKTKTPKDSERFAPLGRGNSKGDLFAPTTSRGSGSWGRSDADTRYATTPPASGRNAGPGVLRISGVLDTPWGPAQLHDMVVDTTRAELDADRQFDRAHMGAA